MIYTIESKGPKLQFIDLVKFTDFGEPLEYTYMVRDMTGEVTVLLLACAGS